jgi:hypothetical protein
MINLILVFCGAILLIYSAIKGHALNGKINTKIVKKSYAFILFLIYLFILGYVLFFVKLLSITSSSAEDLLVSIIFFFGALFVLIVLRVNQKLLLNITEASEQLEKLNTELENKNKELRKEKDNLLISEEKYKKRSIELSDTLDDFYTMRIVLQEQMDKGTAEAENEKIKDRLDKLKQEQ